MNPINQLKHALAIHRAFRLSVSLALESVGLHVDWGSLGLDLELFLL